MKKQSYGDILQKTGEKVERYGKTFHEMGNHAKQQQPEKVKQTARRLIVEVKKDREKYLKERGKVSDREINEIMDYKVISLFDITTESMKKINGVESNNPIDFKRIMDEMNAKIEMLNI